jgi:hypothetical protein
MKKANFFIVAFVLFFSLCKAQIINFPDVNFKNRLLAATPTVQIAGIGWDGAFPTSYVKIDANNDGEIQLSEVSNITYLQTNGSSISNFSGIEYFTNLKFLLDGANPIVSIDLSALTQLEKLSLNNISSSISTINLTGLLSLKEFYSNANQITNLNFSGLPNLQAVGCGGTLISNLDFTGNPLLTTLGCGYNPNLTTIKIKNGTIQQFPDATFCVFDGNPNLHYICADAAEIPVLQNFQTTSCTVNNTCVIDSACALAIEDFEAEKISVFPNPVTSSFVVTTAVSKVVVCTLTGQVVKQFEGSFEANYSFDIQGLSVGIYIVKLIKEDGNEKIVKFVKQ